MFKRLDRKIRWLLLTVVFVYLALSSGLVYWTMESQGTKSLQRMSVQYTGQQRQNAELYMRWMEESIHIATSRDSVRQALDTNLLDETMLPLLDGLRASNADMASLVLYGRKGRVYSSGNIRSLLQLEQLSQTPPVSRFIEAGRPGEWMLLDASALYYPSAGKERRSLFHFSRIEDERGELLGILQLETSVSRLLGFFRTEAGSMYGGNRTYLVASDGEWLDETGRAADVVGELKREAGKSGEEVTERGDSLLLTYKLSHSEDRIAIVTDGDSLKGEIRSLGVVLIAVAAAMLLLFVLLVRGLAESITSPLKSLYLKMRKTMKEP